MLQVNSGDIIAILLLLLFALAISSGAAMVVFLVRRLRNENKSASASEAVAPLQVCANPSVYFHRPSAWLAIKSKNLLAVQSALRLHNPRPCSLQEGIGGEKRLFIAPPVRGWILVTGSDLPDPADDADVCFKFVVNLSRKIGQVQYFSANRVVHHHAWIRADGGKIVRAYAWAGQTVWQQGNPTSSERELGLKCFAYGEQAKESGTQDDCLDLNVERVPMLAARWSLDPAGIDERLLTSERGVAGDTSV